MTSPLPFRTIDRLAPFLAELVRTPFSYGTTDCCLVIASWWQTLHGTDPAAHLRGTYDDEASCKAVVQHHGGMVALIDELARSVGARRTDEPRPGDAGVVRYRGELWGAVMTPRGRWAIKCSDRLFASRGCDVVAAWRV